MSWQKFRDKLKCLLCSIECALQTHVSTNSYIALGYRFFLVSSVWIQECSVVSLYVSKKAFSLFFSRVPSCVRHYHPSRARTKHGQFNSILFVSSPWNLFKGDVLFEWPKKIRMGKFQSIYCRRKLSQAFEKLRKVKYNSSIWSRKAKDTGMTANRVPQQTEIVMLFVQAFVNKLCE